MTIHFLETVPTDLYNNAAFPIALPSTVATVDRLRAIAASDYSVSHRLREMLLTRILFDCNTEPLSAEISVFEQVLNEGQRMGTLWTMNSLAIARRSHRRHQRAFPERHGHQVVDLLLQGLVRTRLPETEEFERAAA